MALSLPPALLAAQDAPLRHPVVELKAGRFGETLPFSGRRLDEIFKDEYGLSALMHSSGRACAAYIIEHSDRTPVEWEVQYVYTNPDRTEFNYITLFVVDSRNGWRIQDLVINELKDKNIGLIVMYERGDMAAYILSAAGQIVSSSKIVGTAGGYGAGILSRNTDYLFMYSKPAPMIVPVIGGSYTDIKTRDYTIVVTKDGTNVDATFRYGSVQTDIPMASGMPVLIEYGLTVSFPAAYYFQGQEFYFAAYLATHSACTLTLNNFPEDGSTVRVAGKTYVFRENLTLLPEDPADPESPLTVQVPYEVKIDHQSKEITLENLNCAINAGSYDESGVGERYANGTQAHPQIYAERKRGSTFLDLTARQAGAITYAVTLGDGCGISLYNTENDGLTGGANSAFSVVTTLPGCKTYTATSPDFLQWSEPQETILRGVVPIRDKQRYYFTKLSNGSVMLWFDCVTGGRDALTAITNIFYALSVDGGYVYDAAKAASNFTTPQIMAKDARCCEKAANRLTLAYNESHSAMRITRDTQGVPPLPGFDNPAGIIFNVDFVRRRAYIDCDYSQDSVAGIDITGGIICVLEIDIDEWRVLRYWNKETAPSVPPIAAGSFEASSPNQKGYAAASRRAYSAGRYNVFIRPGFCYAIVQDVISNTMKELWFADFTGDVDSHVSYKCNINLSGTDWSGKHYPVGAYVNETNQKLWFVLTNGYSMFGYEGDRQEFACLDLSEIFDMSTNRYGAQVVMTLPDQGERKLNHIDYNEAENAWTFCWNNGNVHVIDGNAWGTLYKINRSNCVNFPASGLLCAVYKNGKIYGGAHNTSNEGQYSGAQGICIADLSNGSTSYHVPPFVPISFYEHLGINRLVVSKEELVIFFAYAANTQHRLSAVCVYNVKTDKWTVLNSQSVPGFSDPPGVPYGTYHIAYDEGTGNIYTMGASSYVANGFQVVNINGKVERIVYSNGEVREADKQITFEEPQLLVKGSSETNGHIFYDEEQHLYAFWQRKASGYRKIYWDKEEDDLDLSKYLLRGAEIVTTKTIDGAPNALSFELANGHLFDPTNTQSMMNEYIKKGKKITLKLGEILGGAVVWQTDADTYVVTGAKLTFKRGQYPTIKLECKDRRTFFEQMKITATPYYAQLPPHSVLAGLLVEHGGYTMTHINLQPVDEEGAAVKGQFIDQSLSEIIESVGSRFGYFPAVLPGDIITMRKIDLEKKPDHVYSGAAWLVDYTPDDSFSDLTNKITVSGESPDKTAVVMPEELVAQDAGTIGWFKRKKTKRLYYSEDGTKTCLYPRMVKLESASSVAFKLAGSVREKIDKVDPNNTWVEVKVEGPDLTGVFLGALAMVLTAKLLPGVPNPQYPMLPPAQSKAAGVLECAGMWLAFQCVGAIANYQYEIYAQPVGYVRRSFAYSVVDDELIREANGVIVEKKLDEALCYTVQHCQKVAEFEFKIVKAQRNRVKMTKIGHLQDEVGDTIEINHPYNKLRQRIYLTDITRRILIPIAGSADGHILDDVEGWKL